MRNLDLQRRAFQYVNGKGISIADAVPFDGGDDGNVWFTDNDKSVVKSFARFENYTHELECYQRLQSAGIGRKIRSFNVPELLGFDDGLLVIEMTTVFPPYILDFGKAYLSDPHFPNHVLEEWNDRLRFWWGEHVGEVRTAIAVLRRCGIWYYDAKPGNIMLSDWNPDIDSELDEF